MPDSASPTPLWSPDPARIESTQLCAFIAHSNSGAENSDQLWQESLRDPGWFWHAVWDFAGVIGDPGSVAVHEATEFWNWRFLPEASLNFAENVLAERPGANGTAIVALSESADPEPAPSTRRVSWVELRQETAAMASWLLSVGVGPGDRVAAWMPHVPETIVMFLAASSIGAVFTSTSADFGVNGVVDRFGQTEPKVLLASDGYRYGGRSFDCLGRLQELSDQLPTVAHIVLVGNLAGDATGGPTERPTERHSGFAELLQEKIVSWEQVVSSNAHAELSFAPLPSDHPLYILYSSGTTGKPKCIVHQAGGVLLKHLSEQQLHCDIRAGDNVFYFTTCGWMMWNWLVTCLASGATIVLYDGNPVHPTKTLLFDLAEREGLTLLGVSAKFLDGSLKAGLRPSDTHDLSALRSICSTGSPLSEEGFAWVYDAVKTDVHLASMSGGTDLCGCLVAGDPTKPVFVGEIQQKAFGLGIDVFDENGQPAGLNEKGELVCTTPFPSMPLEFWDDPGGDRYKAAYFQRFGPDVWAHGDFASWEPGGGMVIHGRSDATLNSAGVRIGTAEIYGVVEQLEEIQEAIAVGQEWDGDTRVVLFVRLSENAELTDDLQATIRRELRTKCSPRHVPAVIAAVEDIPRTRSGKIVELAVTEVVHGRPVKNIEALANPEALDLFRSVSSADPVNRN